LKKVKNVILLMIIIIYNVDLKDKFE